jgi:hypothetical protein
LMFIGCAQERGKMYVQKGRLTFWFQARQD